MAEPLVRGATYAGLALVTLATLMLQLLLTRIFSVTMWYHFAFLVISASMFGLTAGALLVHLRPRLFAPERAGTQLAWSALVFAVATALSFVLHLWTAAATRMGETLGSVAAFLALTFLIVSVPFTCSGVCVCLALTRFPSRVGSLYAADLAGAGLGCLALILAMEWFDGPSAVLLVAALAAAGACCFSAAHAGPRLRAAAALAALLLGGAAIGHAELAERQAPLLRLSWVEEKRSLRTVYEKWNAFSYLRVYGAPSLPSPPRGWGLSRALPQGRRIRQMGVGIDSWASTVITHYEGDPETVDYLRFDVTNLVHHLVEDADVLVVGSGGGRDVLSALVFDQRSVRAVEINEDLIALVNERFGTFSGHLDRDPRVRFVNDEARSYLARHGNRYDAIQISMIDTWAATAAGAFALSENALYTQEAFELFLRRLGPRGVLSVSRWYREGEPAEAYRLTALAAAALAASGVEEPRRHLLMARGVERRPGAPVVSTLLVARAPFEPAQVTRFEELAEGMEFPLLLTPSYASDPTLARLADAADLREFTAAFPVDISPPSDDRPFFFHTLRLSSLLSRGRPVEDWGDLNVKAMVVLGAALGVVTVFAALCGLAPLLVRTRPRAGAGSAPFFAFFLAIGLGFMLVEMSQVQRLSLYLGHPTYGLVVVLSTLLLASGAGSALSRRVPAEREPWALGALLAALAVFGAATPPAIRTFAEATTAVRIALAIGLLLPIGLCMGTALPLGMRITHQRASALSAWLWGLNGAASVWASVAGVALAITFGIAAAFWAGVACYALAFASLLRLSRRAPNAQPRLTTSIGSPTATSPASTTRA